MILVLGALCLAGCGYTLGPPVRRDLRRIEVPLFRNDTRERDLELVLTEAVVVELQARGYAVRATGPRRALLSGRIVDVRSAVTSEDPQDRQEAGAVTVTLDLVLTSASGRVIRRWQVSETGEFARARAENRHSARTRAVAELARAVARRLESFSF